MRPAAIALNYSVKDIRNDVRQIYIAIETTSVGLTHARPNNGSHDITWEASDETHARKFYNV